MSIAGGDNLKIIHQKPFSVNLVILRRRYLFYVGFELKIIIKSILFIFIQNLGIKL